MMLLACCNLELGVTFHTNRIGSMTSSLSVSMILYLKIFLKYDTYNCLIIRYYGLSKFTCAFQELLLSLLIFFR